MEFDSVKSLMISGVGSGLSVGIIAFGVAWVTRQIFHFFKSVTK